VSKSFRQAGLREGVLGAHAATWLTAPNLGEIIVLVEIALTAAVILTAIYGPGKYSSRAFRLLPWTAGADTGHSDAGQAPGTPAPGTLTAKCSCPVPRPDRDCLWRLRVPGHDPRRRPPRAAAGWPASSVWVRRACNRVPLATAAPAAAAGSFPA
jgi:hypothetical protein